MAERYFLALLIVLAAFGSIWLALVQPIANSEIALAVLLGLLGLVAVLNLNNVKAGVLIPLFFVAAIAYGIYIYLNNPVGYILASISLLSLIGLVLSFSSISPRRVEAVPVAKSAASSKRKQSKNKVKRRRT